MSREGGIICYLRDSNIPTRFSALTVGKLLYDFFHGILSGPFSRVQEFSFPVVL